MKQLSEYTGEKIHFSQPSFFKRYHELKAGEELLASIQQKGCFGAKWVIVIQNKTWEIYQPSIWKSTMEIREAGYEMPFANFQFESFKSRGTINLPRGEKIKIAPHLFKGFCEITNERGESIVKIKLKSALGDKAEVMFEKRSETIDKNPWILMLAYIIAIVQKHRATSSGF